MPFYILQAGNKLQKVTTAGAVSNVTLPAGVTISTTIHAKYAVLNNWVAVTKAPSINLRINVTDMTATRPLSIPTPSSVITAAAGAAGALTGDYSYKYSYVERSGSAIISESPLSSVSNTVTLASQKGSLTGITVSSSTGVTDRRIYRTTTGGATYFPLAFIADNTTTTYLDNIEDAALGTVAADTDLGNPAGTTGADSISLVTSWKDRLWTVASSSVDYVYYTGVNKIYAWSPSNFLLVGTKGQDATGITAFLPRRDELGVAKRRQLYKIIGTSPTDYQIVNVINGTGVFASESVVIIRDVAYFLAEDGPYSWGPDGLTDLATARVSSWFTTDDYFDRSKFSLAFAVWNQEQDIYELHLTDIHTGVDAWVSYHLQYNLWTGPHITDAFTPLCAAQLEDYSGRAACMIGGSDSNLYRANDVAFLDGATPIEMDITTMFHTGGEADQMKYWGRLAVFTRPQTSGTLTIYPLVGNIGDDPQDSIDADLSKDNQFLTRLGIGRLCQLRFRDANSSEDCQIFGYQVDPVYIVGQR